VAGQKGIPTGQKTAFWLVGLILLQGLFVGLSNLAQYLRPLFPTFGGGCWQIIQAALAAATVVSALIVARRLAQAAYREGEAQTQAAQIASLSELLRALRAQRHDFVNHVQALYGLLEEGEVEEARRYLHSVYGEVRQASQILALGEPAVIALVQAKIGQAEAKGIRLTVRADPEFRYLPVPTNDLNRIIGNLLDNALEAVEGEEEPRRRWAELELSVETTGFCISITNAGEISAEVLPHLFRPGFTTKAGDHQGLGLFTVKNLAARYGGDLEMESGRGKTVFRVTFSTALVRGRAGRVPPAAGAPSAPAGNERRRKFLI